MSVTITYNVNVDIKTQAMQMWEEAHSPKSSDTLAIETARDRAVLCISTLCDLGMEESDYQTLINIAGTVVTERVGFLLRRGELVRGTSEAILKHCDEQFQDRSWKTLYSDKDVGLAITVMGRLMLPYIVELTLESVLSGLREIRAMKNPAPPLPPASSSASEE